MVLLFIAIYLLGCIVISVIARKSVAGPVGFFVLSLLVTPVIAYFFYLMSTPRKGS